MTSIERDAIKELDFVSNAYENLTVFVQNVKNSLRVKLTESGHENIQIVFQCAKMIDFPRIDLVDDARVHHIRIEKFRTN